MAERKRSKDGRRETEEILGARGTVSEQGRKGSDVGPRGGDARRAQARLRAARGLHGPDQGGRVLRWRS